MPFRPSHCIGLLLAVEIIRQSLCPFAAVGQEANPLALFGPLGPLGAPMEGPLGASEEGLPIVCSHPNAPSQLPPLFPPPGGGGARRRVHIRLGSTARQRMTGFD